MKSSQPDAIKLIVTSRLRNLLFCAIMLAVLGCTPDKDSDNIPVSTRFVEGIVVSDLVCRLDPRAETAIATGKLTNQLAFDITGVTPAVVWLADDGDILQRYEGSGTANLAASSNFSFSVSGELVEGMSRCRIQLANPAAFPVDGEKEAEAEQYSGFER